jgi:uncharacterized damage-inducible protein DinB
MPEAFHLAEALNDFLVKPDLFWFTSFPNAIEGLTAEQAVQVPAVRFNSVWGVVLHLTLCQRYALTLLGGEAVEASEFFVEGAWPAVPQPVSEAAWQQAKEELMAINRALSACVTSLSTEALEELVAPGQFKGYQYIQGQMAHNSYHLCEIVNIRHMLGLWLEKA